MCSFFWVRGINSRVILSSTQSDKNILRREKNRKKKKTHKWKGILSNGDVNLIYSIKVSMLDFWRAQLFKSDTSVRWQLEVQVFANSNKSLLHGHAWNSRREAQWAKKGRLSPLNFRLCLGTGFGFRFPGWIGCFWGYAFNKLIGIWKNWLETCGHRVHLYQSFTSNNKKLREKSKYISWRTLGSFSVRTGAVFCFPSVQGTDILLGLNPRSCSSRNSREAHRKNIGKEENKIYLFIWFRK